MSEYTDLTLVQLVEAIRGASISPTEAVDAHFARIAEVNGRVNAIVTVDEDAARRRARLADQAVVDARRAGTSLPPLHGVPMTHKDTHATRGLRTTFGSPVYLDHIPQHNNLVIDRLQAVGVTTTGKNNVPEFAAGSHTFNPVFGTTVNPYDLSRSAGGSSGGAAAAIAAGIQPAGDGSDMGGSLRTPGSFCNIVGYRPTAGRIPIVPARNPWAWLAREGFLARTIGDVRYLMRAAAGPDPRSPGSLPLDDAYASEPEPHMAGVRVAYSEDFGLDVPVDEAVLRVCRAALPVFAELGAEPEPAEPDLRGADEVFQTTRAFDFATAYGEVVRDHREQVKDTVQWNVDKGWALTAADLISAAEARAGLRAQLRVLFGRFDVLVTPAVQVPPFDAALDFPAEVAGVATPNYLDWMRAATLISATGLPSLSVPAGFTADGLPVGLQIVANEGEDRLLLRVAEAFERATGHADRRPVL